MPEIKKRKALAREARPIAVNAMKAAQAAQAASQPAQIKKPEGEVAKKIFDASIREPSREELGPFSSLLFDANLFLNGYLEALRAVENDNPRQPNGAISENSMKRAGAA